MANRILLASILAFLVTGSLYVSTMSRTYGFIDRGELAAVATTLGIAHPTGYPTLTLLGHLAVRVFPIARPVLVLNVLSALWTAAAVAIAALVTHRVLRSSRLPASDRAAASFLGAAFVGLSTTWWSQATGFEVYSLHAVFLSVVTLAFLRYLEDLRARAGRPAFSRWGILFSLSLGLSFSPASLDAYSWLSSRTMGSKLFN